ncbi:MAG: hypothetical protein N2318_00535 [Meiothermus sp.]|nr:hypothetical protein [Meiothermus sp.]
MNEACVLRLASLPPTHRDPFDRLLVCQALEHDLTLVTVDENIKQYLVTQLQARGSADEGYT